SGPAAETAQRAECFAKRCAFSALRNFRWRSAGGLLGEDQRKNNQQSGAGRVSVAAACARSLAASGAEARKLGASQAPSRKRFRGSRIGQPPRAHVGGYGILQDCINFALAFAANSAGSHPGNERSSRG